LHGECNSRIRYVKTCPVHGDDRAAASGDDEQAIALR
jgi:hypothetical protein